MIHWDTLELQARMDAVTADSPDPRRTGRPPDVHTRHRDRRERMAELEAAMRAKYGRVQGRRRG